MALSGLLRPLTPLNARLLELLEPHPLGGVRADLDHRLLAGLRLPRVVVHRADRSELEALNRVLIVQPCGDHIEAVMREDAHRLVADPLPVLEALLDLRAPAC